MPTLSTPTALVEQLLAAGSTEEQERFLHAHQSWLQNRAWADAVADAFKAQADHFLRTEIGRALGYVHLLHGLALLTDNPLYEALGLRAAGNVYGIGQGDFPLAIQSYDAAAAIYRVHNLALDEAKSQVGKIGCLPLLGRHQEALVLGAQIRATLHVHQEWALYTGVTTNLAILHYRLGQGQPALTLLQEAHTLCLQTGADLHLAGIELNLAYVLRSMGRLEQSLQASQQAKARFLSRGEQVEAARADECMATTYLFCGRLNEALALFAQVRAAYEQDSRHYDALVVQLYVTDCLLQLGHFEQVLAACQTIRGDFQERGARHAMSQVLINEAMAHAGLRRYLAAHASLDQAAALFATADNPGWLAVVDLERAEIFYKQSDFAASVARAMHACQRFQAEQQRLYEAQARLTVGRAALQLGDLQQARAQVEQAKEIAEPEDVPWLRHQAYHLQALIARQEGQPAATAVAFDRALTQVERLRSRVMVEFRADFLTDKTRVYEDAIQFCLECQQPEQALHYAERAKSRALMELLADQLNLRIEARSAADQELTAELQRLREQRNQLVRGWQGAPGKTEGDPRALQQRLLTLEQRMTELWHTLLIRNADYAREASLATVRTEPIQPYLDPQTLLLEYFIVHDELVAFLITADQIQAIRLPNALAALASPARLLALNWKAAAVATTAAMPRLLTNTQQQLHRLYRLLLEPLTAVVARYPRLIIVPHGPLLHYIPFHALYDGTHYQIEKNTISYLPSASLLHYLQRRHPTSATTQQSECRALALRDQLAGKNKPTMEASPLVLGFSNGGRLPFVVDEAHQVAHLVQGRVACEEAATLALFRTQAETAPLLHLATHGVFNQENPLFSGLTLADGQLSVLDVFALRLRASLVTLSACQTGQSVVRGGDELLGLMRAFLYAGASSLLLSHWQVNDHSTLHFMTSFYRSLAHGASKGDALRAVQQRFIHSHDSDPRYQHPYYWAPFFLAGESGAL